MQMVSVRDRILISNDRSVWKSQLIAVGSDLPAREIPHTPWLENPPSAGCLALFDELAGGVIAHTVEIAIGNDTDDLQAQQVVLKAGGGREVAAGGQGHFQLDLLDELVEAVVAGGGNPSQGADIVERSHIAPAVEGPSR